MYTSIPQSNDNWHIFVDGEEAPITLIGDTMIGVMLTEGQHQISIRYENRALRNGAIISGVCAVSFLVIIWYVCFYLKKKKGKFSATEDK